MAHGKTLGNPIGSPTQRREKKEDYYSSLGSVLAL